MKGRCEYCLRIEDDLRECQIKYYYLGKLSWDRPKFIGIECRGHLIGQFRYVK